MDFGSGYSPSSRIEIRFFSKRIRIRKFGYEFRLLVLLKSELQYTQVLIYLEF